MRHVLLATIAALVLLTVAPAGRSAVSPSRWCGSGETATDLPDTSANAFQVHVIYAYASDVTDRFPSLSLGIARDIAAIDTWWRAQDSSRAPRWDLASFPGCDTAYGQLDISSVKLPRPTGYYANLDTVLDRLSADLSGAGYGFDDPDKKYVVLYDGLLNQGGGNYSVCGLSPTSVHGGGPDAYAAIFLMPPCGDGLGGATNTAGTIAHELIHNLGALPPTGPPHRCPDGTAHPCDSDRDVLSPSGEYGRILTELQLDVGRDDYYDHSGSWWDIKDSGFLEHVGQSFGTPTGPAGLVGSNEGGKVSFDWKVATSPNGAIAKYRVSRDGVLLGTVSGTATGFADDAEPLSTHTWTVQAEDALGFLAPAQTVRYTLTDTAATATPATSGSGGVALRPAQVSGLRARSTSATTVLSWAKPLTVRPPIGVYWVKRNGKLFAQVRKGRSLAVPKAKAKGAWTVTAVSIEGIAGTPSAPLRLA